MVKEIVKDKIALSDKCVYSEDYIQIVLDLIDTANFYKANCLGLAANQIGYNNRVIVIKINNVFIPFVNPIYIRKYKTAGFKSSKEGCLSFPRLKTQKRRYKKISISYFDPHKNVQVDNCIFTNKIAKIIQHEMDHLDGILI